MPVPLFRRFRSLLVLLSTLGGASVAIGQVGGPPPAALPEDVLPGLQTLLEKALQQSPQLVLKNIEVATAEANVYSAKAAMYPTIGASASYASNETAVSEQEDIKSKSDGLYYSLAVIQPIFHWGALKAQADIAKLTVKMAERQYAEAYRTLVLTIRGQYLTLMAKKLTLRNLRNGLRISETLLATQEARLSNGAISTGEIIDPRLQVEEARIVLERAEVDFSFGCRLLAQLTGAGELTEDSIPTQLPKPIYSKESLDSYRSWFEQDGVKNLPISVFYAHSLQQADLNYKIARVRLLPKVGLSASYGVQNQTNASPNSVSQVGITTTSVGIAANWTIFDGFATRGAKLAALANKRSVQRALQTYTETQILYAQNTERQLAFSARLVDLTETRYALAHEGVRLTADNVRLGRAPQSLLDTFTQGAFAAELNALSARIEYFSRWSDYLSTLGVDPILQKLPARYLRNGK